MVELIQYKGPFQSGYKITVPAQIGTIYTHIGIQVIKPKPSFVPASEVLEDGKITTLTGEYRAIEPREEIAINGIKYHLNQNGILEFDGLGEIEWNIQFLTSFPPETIVDIIREEQRR